jgi:hypothetical protein
VLRQAHITTYASKYGIEIIIITIIATHQIQYCL